MKKSKKKMILIASIIITSIIIIGINKIKLKEKELTSISKDISNIKNEFNSLKYKKKYEVTYNNILSDLEDNIVNKDLNNAKTLYSELEEIYIEASKYSDDINNEKNNIDYIRNEVENFYLTKEYKEEIENIISQFDIILSNEEIDKLESNYDKLHDIYKKCNENFKSDLTYEYTNLNDYFNSKIFNSNIFNDNYDELIEKDPTIVEDVTNIKSKIEGIKTAIDNATPKNNNIFEKDEYENLNDEINSIKNDINNLYENKIRNLISDILKNKAKEKENLRIEKINNNGFSPYNIVKNILPEFIQVDQSSDRIVESENELHITSTIHNNSYPTVLTWHYIFSDIKITSNGATYTFEVYKYENRFDGDTDNEKNYKLALNDGEISYLKDGTIKYKNKISKKTKLQAFD